MENNQTIKKYTVNQAIWLAAAVLAFKTYLSKDNIGKKDMYFKQYEILHLAETFTENKVDFGRISLWLNGDDEKSTHNYLRAGNIEDESLRRLSSLDEFSSDTYPSDLNMEDVIEYSSGENITIGKLYEFVKNEYSKIINKVENIDIDYIGILNYLINNQEVPYSNPEAPGLDPDEKARLLEVKKKGQAVVSELKKITAFCKENFGLDKSLPISWLDGSNTKTRKYLWSQMKYSEYASNPISISLFVEKNNKVARYRISLEIKNDGTDKSIVAKYHTHLDLPKADNMVYVAGSNEWGNPKVITDSVDVIKQEMESGKLRKVQLCIYIEPEEGKTNNDYHQEIMAAIKALIPYYNHVVDKKDLEDDGYWPTQEEYQVELTKENWVNFISTIEMTHKGCMRVLACFVDIGGEASPKLLSETYGGHPTVYTGSITNTCGRALDFFSMDPCPDGVQKRQFPIGFQGKQIGDNYTYRIRKELLEALKEIDLSEFDLKYKQGGDDGMVKFDKNMILYGPPGTGKTYSTAIYTVAICDNKEIDEVKKMQYEDVVDRYRQLTDEGRVAFTTFHQSYGYEEFIEGIKPVVDEDATDVSYKIEDGIFKDFCLKSKTPIGMNYNRDANIWFMRLDSENVVGGKEDCFTNNMITINPAVKASLKIEVFQEQMEVGDYILSSAGNSVYIDAIGVIESDVFVDPLLNRKVKWFKLPERVDVKSINGNHSLPKIPIAKMKYIKLYDLMNLIPHDDLNKHRPYVFVIDEINRGNISKIFGELITLIEDTKREGMLEEASAILPYSHEKFSVPSNVYILGTMNTADRSIAVMDTALRRRFQFVEMIPDSEVLRDIGSDKVEDLDVAKMLDTINERITFLYDREHKIGHAFFTGLAQEPTIEKLASIFSKSVIPLLQEYFYEDYQKIQLVLGDNGKTDPNLKFIKDEKVTVKNIFKGNPDDIMDLPEVKYSINEKAFYNIESYKQIM